MKPRNLFRIVGIPTLKALLAHKAVGAALVGGATLAVLHSLPLHFIWPSAGQFMLAAAIVPGLYFFRSARVGVLYPARIGQLAGIADWLAPESDKPSCVCESVESPEQLYRFKHLIEETLLDLSGEPGSAERVAQAGPGLCLLADVYVATAIASSRGNVWLAARDLLCAHAAEPDKISRPAAMAGAAHWALGAAGFVGLAFLLVTPLLTVPEAGIPMAIFLGTAVAAYLTCVVSSAICAPLLSWELLKECRSSYAGRAAAPEQVGALSARSPSFRELLTLAELGAAPDMPDGP